MTRLTTALLIALLLAPTLLAQEKAPEKKLTNEQLAALAKEVIPLLEREAGVKFTKPPTVRIGTRTELGDGIEKELLPVFEKVLAGQTKEQILAAAKASRTLLVNATLARFSLSQAAVLFIPENLERRRKHDKPMAFDDALRVLMIHELSHALDEQTYKLFSSHRAKICTSIEALEVFGGLAEGHAQLLTYKVLDRAGKGAQLQQFIEWLARIPDGLDEAVKLRVRVHGASIRFLYERGFRFVKAMEEAQPSISFTQLLEKPPARKSVIIHPERYGKPPEIKLRDVDPLFESLRKLRPRWQAMKQAVGELQLEQVMKGYATKEQIRGALEGLVAAKAMAMRSDAAGTSMIVISVCQLETAEHAKKFYAATKAVSKAKDEKMTSGTLKILESDYAPLKHDLVPENVRSIKVMEYAGKKATVTGLGARVRGYVIEVIFSNEAVTDAKLGEILTQIARFLTEPPKKKEEPEEKKPGKKGEGG